jgi:Flp pilus assembly pilin Flp
MTKLAVAKKFAAREEGASLVEYSLLVALLAGAGFAILYGLGQNIHNIFNTSNSAVTSASNVITSAS